MKLFQIVVVGAVLFANIHWQITPNGYLASIAAFLAALFATLAVVGITDLARRVVRGWDRRKASSAAPPPLP